MNLNTQTTVHLEYRRLGDGDLRRRGGEGERRLRAGEGERLFLKEYKCKIWLSWFSNQHRDKNHLHKMSNLGDTSLCRRRGEGVRLRLLLTSPFLAPGPDVGLLGPSSSEEEEPPSEIKERALTVQSEGKKFEIRTKFSKSMR